MVANSWLQEVKTNPHTVSTQSTILLISNNSFTFLGDEEFDSHFIGYSEEGIFMQQPRAYIFTNLKIKHIKNNTFLKVLVMSLSPSQFLLFLRMNSTYMTPLIPQTLTSKLQIPQHQIQTPQHQNTSSHTSRG